MNHFNFYFNPKINQFVTNLEILRDTVRLSFLKYFGLMERLRKLNRRSFGSKQYLKSKHNKKNNVFGLYPSNPKSTTNLD